MLQGVFPSASNFKFNVGFPTNKLNQISWTTHSSSSKNFFNQSVICEAAKMLQSVFWPECDGAQIFFRYHYRYFFQDQIFLVPVPIPVQPKKWKIPGNFSVPVLNSRECSGTSTKFFRYRYRYFFLGPNCSGTGTSAAMGRVQKNPVKSVVYCRQALLDEPLLIGK